MINKRRTRNRILQAFYRPTKYKKGLLPKNILSALDEIDKGIEETITPLLNDLFD